MMFTNPWAQLGWEIGIAALPLILSAIIPALMTRLYNKWGVTADEARRAALNDALVNGITFTIEHLGLTNRTVLSATDREKIAKGAADYAQAKVPQTAKKLGVTPDSLVDLAVARLPQVLGNFGLWGKLAGAAVTVGAGVVKDRAR
jgi:hypothetical protein